MSISEQVKELRDWAISLKSDQESVLANVVSQAADTIESMKRTAEDCGGWIQCDKDNLPDKEVLCCDQCGEMILGYVFEDETSETGFSAENGNVYMYGCTKWMEKPKP